ncbi:MAG: ABC transporter substrate-binding protein, partial [Bacteroidaceae bacterium]|nr:ABC transporter substrate-binding protein [Bacteroidaceae bacterium]
YLIVSRWGKNPLKQKRDRLAVYMSEPNYLSFIMDRKMKMNYEYVFFTGNINVFLSGGVDLMRVVSFNEYLLLKQAGFDMPEESVFRFKDNGYNIQENGVYVKREYYETHRDQVKRFAAASKKGWDWAYEHPDEALDIVMKYVRGAHVQTNRVIQKLMLEEVFRLQKDADSGRREYRVRPEMVQQASHLMKEFGMIEREVSYGELMGK